jgi:S1-C subfamily serine protease
MKKVVGDIMKYGSVQRGYLGISMAPEGLDDAKKKELGINSDISGVFVAEVDPKGAAGEGGLKKGDVITKIDDREVSSDAQLAELIARDKPGDKVKITYMRDGSEKTTDVVLKNTLGSFASMASAAVESMGADFATLSKEDAQKMGIEGGVRVSNIRDGVLSNQTEMRPGFVITKVSGIPVHTVDEFKSALAKQKTNFVLEGVYPEDKEVYYYGINGLRK